MFPAVVLGFAMMQAAQQQPAMPTQPCVAVATGGATAKPLTDVERQLFVVKRIYVDSFGADPQSEQLRAMVISSLVEGGRIRVTEDKDKADAILRGVGLIKTSQEKHSYGEATGAVGIAAGAYAEDSSSHTETIEYAKATTRLVSKEGDIIWATTQESKGAKYKGATADCADLIVKQLLRDLERLQKRAQS